MRILLINYYSTDWNPRFNEFIASFRKNYLPLLKRMDSDIKIQAIQNHSDLSKYCYRNKQNYSNVLVKKLSKFQMIDLVFIGTLFFTFDTWQPSNLIYEKPFERKLFNSCFRRKDNCLVNCNVKNEESCWYKKALKLIEGVNQKLMIPDSKKFYLYVSYIYIFKILNDHKRLFIIWHMKLFKCKYILKLIEPILKIIR